jgi:hypothetical protein
VVAYPPRFFALRQECKDALRIANSPHFLGVERTRGAADQRELFDFATPLENLESRWTPGKPEYLRLWGPSQVGAVYFRLGYGDRLPAPKVSTGQKRRTFRDLRPRSCDTVHGGRRESELRVVQLVAEAPDGLARFFDARERMQYRAKVQYAARRRLGREDDCSLASFCQIVKYPTRDEVGSEQGIGPHFDGGFPDFRKPAFSPSVPTFPAFPICGAMRQSIHSFNDDTLYLYVAAAGVGSSPAGTEFVWAMDRGAPTSVYVCH